VVIVFVFPLGDGHSGLSQRPELVDVQALVAKSTNERFDEWVLPGFAWRDEPQTGLLTGPIARGVAGELWTVVRSQDHRSATFAADAVQLSGQGIAGDAALEPIQQAKTTGTIQHTHDVCSQFWAPHPKKQRKSVRRLLRTDFVNLP
jgi:hypothetical protein